MKTFFLDAYDDGRTVPAVNGVIGDGKPGAKTRALLEKQKLFDSTVRTSGEYTLGFLTLPSVSITPDFFKDYLNRIGASHENPVQALKAIEKAKFDKSELEAFAEALSPFEKVPVAVRSDESTAHGVGLWHTGFMTAGTGKSSIIQVSRIVKEILKSDFSRDAIAFKKRTGLQLDETPGVLVTPLAVDGVAGFYPNLLTNYYHVNLITNFLGSKTAVSIGVGIGGANNRHALHSFIEKLRQDHLREGLDLNTICSNIYYRHNLGFINEVKDGLSRFHRIRKSFDSIDSDAIETLKESLEIINSSFEKPLYLELAMTLHGGGGPKWTVVQCAEVDLKQIQRPADISEKDLVFSASRNISSFNVGTSVTGRDIVGVGKVLYRSRTINLKEINQGLENYLLVTDEAFSVFSQNNSFADYSNAMAIVTLGTPYNPIVDHFNGAFRAAGIIGMSGRFDNKFLNGLHEGVNERELLIYAHDGLQEGFIAQV